jgi:hypothetical protein
MYEKKTPMFIWGATGIGKSQTSEVAGIKIAEGKKMQFTKWNSIIELDKVELCKAPEGKFVFLDLRFADADPTDTKGLPDLVSHDYVNWKKELWVKFITTKGATGIVFFDEMNLAPPLVQSTLYNIILDRFIGQSPLSDGIMVIAAGNRLEDMANIYEMAVPLRNRFAHCELKVPSTEKWTDWAFAHNINPKLISFINFRQSYLFKFDAESKDYAFPTPRSLAMCSKMLEDVKDKDTISTLASMAIGEGTAIEFMAFLKSMDKLNVNEYLDNPDKCELPEEVDTRYALVSALAERYGESKKILIPLLKIIKRVEPEFGHLLLRTCIMYEEGKDYEEKNKKFSSIRLQGKEVAPLWQEIALKKLGKYLISK